MKINRKELIENLKKLMPGIDSKDSMIFEGSNAFTFTGKAIHSYNDSISVSVLAETGLTGAIRSKEFFKLLQKLLTDEIEIIQEEGIWKLVSGNTEADLKLIDSKISEYIQQMDLEKLEWKTLSEDFYDALKLSKISCSSSNLRGIYVSGFEMLSTDETRINRYQLKSEMDTFWLDDPAITELLRIGEKAMEYSVSGSWVHFLGQSGTIFSCRKNNADSYPREAIKKHLVNAVKNTEDIGNVFPMGFKICLDRIGVLSEDLFGYAAVKLHLGKEKLDIMAKRDIGSIKESLKWETPFLNEVDINITADVNFLMQVSDKCPNFYLKIFEQNGKEKKVFIFQNENFTQLLSTIME